MVYSFSKDVNVIASLKIKLDYFKAAVLHFSHYATGIFLLFCFEMNDHLKTVSITVSNLPYQTEQND